MTYANIENHPYILAVDTYDRETNQHDHDAAAKIVFDAIAPGNWSIMSEYYSLVGSNTFSPADAFRSLAADILGTPDLEDYS